MVKKKKGIALVRNRVHHALSFFVGGIYKLLCKAHIFTPHVIVYVDGGICSQMYQYMIGQRYALNGESVIYDLSWYDRDGMDVDNRFRRIFELEQMFPTIHVDTGHPRMVAFYRFFLKYTSKTLEFPPSPKGLIAPIYLGGYYRMEDELFTSIFNHCFSISMREVPYEFKTSFPNQVLCAVHVRRGDLAKGDNPYYGGVTDDFFFKAIDYVEKKYPHSKYCFFSDEMEYVRRAIVPKLNIEYELMDHHFKAYEDLVLMSKCSVIIASQGSFGKIAGMMNKDSLLILQDDKFAKPWLNRKTNSIAL